MPEKQFTNLDDVWVILEGPKLKQRASLSVRYKTNMWHNLLASRATVGKLSDSVARIGNLPRIGNPVMILRYA